MSKGLAIELQLDTWAPALIRYLSQSNPMVTCHGVALPISTRRVVGQGFLAVLKVGREEGRGKSRVSYVCWPTLFWMCAGRSLKVRVKKQS